MTLLSGGFQKGLICVASFCPVFDKPALQTAGAILSGPPTLEITMTNAFPVP